MAGAGARRDDRQQALERAVGQGARAAGRAGRANRAGARATSASSSAWSCASSPASSTSRAWSASWRRCGAAGAAGGAGESATRRTADGELRRERASARMTDEDLDSLSTHELHDRAVRRAERHLDVKFFWRLLQLIPAAQTVSGDVGEGDYDIQSSKGLDLRCAAQRRRRARRGAAARLHRLPARAPRRLTRPPPLRSRRACDDVHLAPAPRRGTRRRPKRTCARWSCSACASGWTACAG